VILGAAIVILVAAVIALVIHHQSNANALDRGSLTSDQYATAVDVARAEIAKDHATVSQAVATVVPGTIRTPNLSDGCT
jgi:hypothetical protein